MGKMNLFKVTMFLVILVISFRMRYRLTQIVLLKNFKLKIIIKATNANFDPDTNVSTLFVLILTTLSLSATFDR